MRERTILLKQPEVRGILDGRISQIRREWKLGHTNCRWWNVSSELDDDGWPIGETDDCEHVRIPCPFGMPGDILIGKETWVVFADHVWNVADVERLRHLVSMKLVYKADGIESPDGWFPSVHMPKWASRINLEITDVRFEMNDRPWWVLGVKRV